MLINTPGLCDVQYVVDLTLAAAKHKLAHGSCRLGTVTRASSKRIKRGLVISQKPGFGAVRPKGTKVDLVISRGAGR